MKRKCRTVAPPLQTRGTMNLLMSALALIFLLVPGLRAQQSESNINTDQTVTEAPQVAPRAPISQIANSPDNLPADLRPGHPLDAADVDILTGKHDREIEAARQSAVPVMAGIYGEYGTYGDYFWRNTRLGSAWDMPMLPLARIVNPFFFSRISPRGFGRRGFRGGL